MVPDSTLAELQEDLPDPVEQQPVVMASPEQQHPDMRSEEEQDNSDKPVPLDVLSVKFFWRTVCFKDLELALYLVTAHWVAPKDF